MIVDDIFDEVDDRGSYDDEEDKHRNHLKEEVSKCIKQEAERNL